MDLNELADRVEALAGPDREIDAAIFAALKLGTRDWMHQSPQAERVWARQYTKSIDAAMTLVPEGRGWSVGQDERGNRAIIGVGGMETVMAKAASPAIALTAASLRARTKALGAVHTVGEG